MPDDAGFASSNQHYLQTGLAWLRACLAAEAAQHAPAATAPMPDHASGPAPGPAAMPPAPPAAPSSIWPWRRHAALPPPIILSPPTMAEHVQAPVPDTAANTAPDAATVATIAAAREAYESACAAEPVPALVALSERLGLNAFEREMLLLAAAPELDPDMPALIAAAHGDAYRRAPTFALGMRLFDNAGWDALAPERPLRALQLLEVHQSGADSLLAAPLRIDERIAAFVKGVNYLDERLDALVTPLAAPPALPPSQQQVVQQLAHWLVQDGHDVVQLLGADPASKRDVLAAAAAGAGRTLLAIQATALPAAPLDAERFVQLWRRESLLLPLCLLVEDAGTHGPRDEGAPAPAVPGRLLRRLAGAVFVATPHADGAWDSAAVIAVEPPTAAERSALWRTALGGRDVPGGGADGVTNDADDADDEKGDLARLANEFPLAASRIAALAAGAHTAPDRQRPLEPVWNACVEHTAGALDGLAQRIAVRATLDDVALPPHEKQQLQRLVDHARQRVAVLNAYGFAARVNRGIGLAALLHGESGTGKTMAAEAVADALSLALFRVDLSAVVSKYIGETSKNLRRVFDAADGGGAVLLFDEADAVFGKRSEVKDSHDRYANIDINYLLTRMEQFGGVTLLATNMKHALDQAFVRRLRFIIGFPFPGVAERRAIWSRIFPEQAWLDTAQIDLDRLARFALTGGSIFNAALAAAHDAAGAHAPIGMPHILEAIRWELKKIGRPVAEHEFAWNPPPAYLPVPVPVEAPA